MSAQFDQIATRILDGGSATPDDDPTILVLFPNNRPSRTPTLISTDT